MPDLQRTARLMVCACALACAPVQAFDRGEALYENHCKTCHEAQVHLRENRRAVSLDDLSRRVAAWSIHASLGWSAEEVADVAGFLNRRFYHFPEPSE